MNVIDFSVQFMVNNRAMNNDSSLIRRTFACRLLVGSIADKFIRWCHYTRIRLAVHIPFVRCIVRCMGDIMVGVCV